ncbi:MAG: ATP synthase F1 subunit delta [Bacteroidales bacterium]|nr:ATP synthase F1 subunit delta [Bacteroidales bacterium]MCK9499424.1 ATP synthase F1 subunit delta [Bacteroidales bacterium]
MNQSKISVRYSKAIFESAKEQNILDEIYADFQLITSSIKANENFYQIFTSPVIKFKDKKNVLNNVFSNSITKISLKFLFMLIDNNREAYISDIAREFASLYREYKNIKEVVLTTATDIDNSISQKFAENVSKELNCKVELVQNVKPEIIGGVVVRIDNLLLDMSVETQLRNIKSELRIEKY